MKPTLLKNVKNGDYFTLTDKVRYNEDGEVLEKYVYVRSDYEKSLKKYEVYKFSDVNDFRHLKGDRIVYVDFFF